MSAGKGSGSFPGFEYIDRIGQAWMSAVTAHFQVLNDAWSQVRQGKGDHLTMMQAMAQGWAKTAEAYYGVTVEASRGPGFVYQPAWLAFDYTPGVPETVQSTIRIDGTVQIARVEAASTQLDHTPFAALDLQYPIINPRVYEACEWVAGSRSQIYVKLNKQFLEGVAKLKAVPGPADNDPGLETVIPEERQYISFILPRGRTGEPPLAIVLLRIHTGVA